MVLDNGLVYASHSQLNTEIVFAGTDNSIAYLDTLNGVEHFNFYSKSKVYTINDSLYQIILYSLVDYDITAPGIIVYTLCKDKLISREQVLWDEYSDFVADYVRTSSGEGWALRGQNNALVRVTSDFEVLESFEQTEFYEGLFLDDSERLFGTRLDQLFEFDGGTFVLLEEFGMRILDVSHVDGSSYVLFENELRRYDADFSQLLTTWAVSPSVASFRQIDINQDQLLVAYTEEESSFIDRLSTDGSVASLWTGDAEAVPGQITQLHVQDDATYLSSGEYRHINTSQSFFRAIPTDSDVSYDRKNVDLVSARIEQTVVEKEFLGTNAAGDSIFRVTADYDFDFQMDNQGLEEVSDIHIYGPSPYGNFGPNKPLHYTAPATIAPQETANFVFAERTTHSFNDLTFSIPGVCQRFNLGSSVLVDFISSTSNPIIESKDLVFPNPAIDLISFRENLDVQSYIIYDMQGQVVIKGNRSASDIDISTLSPGTYNLVVHNGTGQYIHKIVKQ